MAHKPGAFAIVLVALAAGLSAAGASAPHAETITLRGHAQHVQVYGDPDQPIAIVSSGDGGWKHLGPHVAEALAAHGYRVIGFDVKSYLASFTTSTSALSQTDVPADYAELITTVTHPGRPVLLVGVSEGASLSVLAATNPRLQSRVSGVIAFGLPDKAELGWRLVDTLIYVTHTDPREPMFSTASIVAGMSPVPLAAIHSTHDEFVPLPEVGRVMAAASDPKRLWVVNAANHRFSDNLGACDAALFEAAAWIGAHKR
jgi:dienelactone hydrolase